MTNKHPAKTWGFWASRGMETIAALAGAFLIINILEYRQAEQKANVPSTDWWVINDIYVPDHEVGTNPNMVYDRTIKVSHRGFWVVEAQRQNADGKGGVFGAACTGSGVNDYDPGEIIVEDTVEWGWFFGRPCTIPPGTYRLQLTKDMTKPGYPVKQSRDYSNTFRVYAPGEMPGK